MRDTLQTAVSIGYLRKQRIHTYIGDSALAQLLMDKRTMVGTERRRRRQTSVK